MTLITGSYLNYPGGGIPKKRRSLFVLVFMAAVLALPLPTLSCQYKEPVQFPFQGGTISLYGLSLEASEGRLPFARDRKYSYIFEGPIEIPENTALELEYRFPEEPLSTPDSEVTLEWGGSSWVLPRDGAALGLEARVSRYTLPLAPGLVEGFSITVSGGEDNNRRGNRGGTEQFELCFLGFSPRWYGFIGEGDSLSLSPFVRRDGTGPAVFVIDPPRQYRLQGKIEAALVMGSPGPLILRAGNLRVEGLPVPEAAGLLLPPGLLPIEPYPLVFQGETSPRSFTLIPAQERPFPEPFLADPGIILAYPREKWRDPRYELFRWDRFPGILIFDTASYALQERLFKRLAFFVEKAGFRGRLATDREIADLHGWNAHDYRPEDLAAFFEAARKTNFPLLPEERELERILLSTGIIRRQNGEFRAGTGAVLSISRESSESLRNLFMVHEGFHGLFFIDQDFRDWSRRRWENFSPQAKRFIRSYFDYQTYDVGDSYLVVNEFMAYCLQQPASQASWYFGENLAGRLASSWRRNALPPGEGPYWPELGAAFGAEAAAFSAYVEARWGLAAGRVRRVLP